MIRSSQILWILSLIGSRLRTALADSTETLSAKAKTNKGPEQASWLSKNLSKIIKGK